MIKRSFKYLSWAFASLLAVIIILLLLVSFVYQDRAKKEIAGYASRYIGAEISFEDVNVSLLRNFPRMRLEIINVILHDGNNEPVKARSLTLLFKAGSLFGNILDIEKIIIQDAAVNFITDEKGGPGRLFDLQDYSSGGTGKNLLLNSQEISARNLVILSENKIKNNLTKVTIGRGQFTLDINGAMTRIKGEIRGNLDSLVSRGTTLFSDLPFKVDDFDYLINEESGVQHLESGLITAAGLDLYPSLTLEKQPAGNKIDLSIHSEDNVNAFLSLLKMKIDGNIEQVNPHAKASLEFRQTGLVTPDENPFTTFQFLISDAEIKSEKLAYPITGLTIRGNYNNGKGHCRQTARVEIDTLHAAIGESFVSGHLLVEDLKHPVVNGKIQAKMDLANLVKPGPELQARGVITLFADVKGHLSDFESYNISGPDISYGDITFKALDFFLEDSMFHVRADSGKVTIKNHLLDIEKFSGTLNGEPFTLEGTVSGIETILAERGDKALIRAELNFQAPKLTLDKILFISGKQNDRRTNASPVEIEVNAGLNVDTLIAGPVRMGHLNANTRYVRDRVDVEISGLDYAGCKANLKLDLSNPGTTGQVLKGWVNLKFDTLDIRSFLDSLAVFASIGTGDQPGTVQDGSHLPTDIELGIYAGYARYDMIFSDSLNVTGRISGALTEIDTFGFNYAGGHASLQGIFRHEDDNTVSCNVMTRATGMDIDQLLGAFGNFGQSYLTSQSITGKVSWTGNLYFRLDSDLDPVPGNSLWKFDFFVDDARITGIEPVEKALSFIRQKSKENIIVSNMDFITYYSKDQLYINNVMIKNSISDMNVSGIYSPEDKMLDLDIQLSLSDLLFKSMKRRVIETEDGEVDLGNDRRLNLKFNSTGGQHQVKIAGRKEHKKNLARLQNQFDQFDRELSQKISGLTPGKTTR